MYYDDIDPELLNHTSNSFDMFLLGLTIGVLLMTYFILKDSNKTNK